MAKINFGFSAVQAGQKSSTVNAEPRLIANSTPGKFVITSPVSKALGIAVGENIQFLNNISEVETAVAQRHEAIVAWANENGIDLDTREGQDAAVKHFTVWAIAKGVPQYNQKGEPVMANIRYTRDEKIAAILNEIDNFLEDKDIYANMAKVMQNDSFTKEEFVEVLTSEEDNDFVNAVKNAAIECVNTPQYHSATGSKTSTTGTATGVGCQLNFTDTAIWGALKADLENKESKNRNYRVVLEDAFETEVPDGQKTVKITAFPIEFIDDTDPIVREKKN